MTQSQKKANIGVESDLKLEIIKELNSKDGAIKYLQKLENGTAIETAYVDYFNKHIICFSSQIGCAVGCVFCITGLRSKNDRYKRSLTAKELIEQCENIVEKRTLRKSEKPILFSCMGEGEPLLNYKNVLAALRALGMHYPNSRLALSTSGIKPHLIKLLSHENFPRPFKLQISIHAPNNLLRKTLVPVSGTTEEIIGAIQYYRKTGKPIDINYILFENLNDTEAHAKELVSLLGPGWHVKFNTFNPVANSALSPSSKEKMWAFRAILETSGMSTEFYKTNGSEIMAACGQLTYQSV